MRLYLDENIPVALAPILAAAGLDCLTTREAGNLSLSDEAQLGFASQEGRVLVTFNCKDFLPLVVRWQQAGRFHAGLIVCQELVLPELVRRFRHLIAQHRDEDLGNKVLWLPAATQNPKDSPSA